MSWPSDLGTRPSEPMSPLERLLVAAGSLVVAISRIAFLARSPWDWDEMLFALAVRDFDVSRFHPHPPGFPLFIGAAKLLAHTGLSEFRALQGATLLGSVLLFPAMVLFGRELRLPLRSVFGAAMLLSFFPNVWFFSETAFSDVPSLVLVLFAGGLLLRGCRSESAYLAGALLLAAAAGFRPQNLIVGIAPGVLATCCQLRARRFGLAIGAAALGGAVIAASYGASIAASGGWGPYRAALATHGDYIRQVDSFLSPTRPPLYKVVDDFFFWPFRVFPINAAIAVLSGVSAVVSIARRRRPVLLAIATFAPMSIVAWLMLDWLSASRFAIGYAPLVAVLCADGIAIVARGRRLAASLLTAALVAALMIWALPGLRLAARELSPPAQAAGWIRANLDPKTRLFAGALAPHAAYFLPDYPRTEILASAEWALQEGSGARTFRWPRDPLWNIARRRYFEVSVTPLR